MLSITLLEFSIKLKVSTKLIVKVFDFSSIPYFLITILSSSTSIVTVELSSSVPFIISLPSNVSMFLWIYLFTGLAPSCGV